jgi:hypothetical protein
VALEAALPVLQGLANDAERFHLKKDRF